jgi:prevent-host-death family protein
MKTIPQRELRNRISQILRDVEGGEGMRITVNGRPVADLIPASKVRRTFVPKDQVMEILGRAPLDRNFERDCSIAGATIEEL